MGKKYIIELESGTHIFVLGPEGIVHIGEPDVVYETVDGMQIGDAVINAKPYTEPDLDAIKQEEYEKGYKTAKVQCDIQTEKDLREVGERHYQKGLSDAWEAARKIWKYDTTTLRAIFGEGIMRMDWFMKFTASEVIEKIRQYEQEKEQPVTAEDVMRQYLDTFCKGRSCTNCLLCTPDFTCGRGKHFLHNCVSDEEVRRAYAAVLAKMKES